MKVCVINWRGGKAGKEDLIQWVKGVSEELKHRRLRRDQVHQLTKTLTLAFVSRAKIRSLNGQFRKKHSATDILSFATVEEGSLGELVLCLSVIRQKVPDGFSYKEWLYYLVLHGILHLLGFNHTDTREGRMYRLQDSLFKKCYP